MAQEEIWINEYWYDQLECLHCKKPTKHRVKGHCFGLEELKNVVVYLLLPLRVSEIQISRLEQAGKFGISCEQGKVNIATCVSCCSRSLKMEKDIKRDYFWHELHVCCKGCGKQLERNNTEQIAYCFNEGCEASGISANHYRCPECGCAELENSFSGRNIKRCGACGASSVYRVRTAC